ncbi:MAG: diacylglycerol kinase family lipid kinase [Bacteroidaceae bacterium]|nr:diacylglycerol kinase family lipid kinase [Bacteroidaceae bacterium]MCR4770192.1 diacylglycerol kinase family lipid kinase [Bacteroidaceae bacterium]
MLKKKILFIYNPISGISGKKMILSQIESKLDTHKFIYDIQKTQYAGHATELARNAVREGVDIVCAVGGDGTINEIGRALIHTTTALAIIPCGSGNGLARHLHIPLDPIRAIDLINEGEPMLMDYGVINLHPFFCTCGVGFDAIISEKFAKSKFRGPLSYLENVLKTSLNYNSETYDIDIVDENEEHSVQKAFLISCGNASQYGNNVYITPQASVRDGLLDVTLMKPFTVIDAPQIALHLLNGTVDDGSLFSTFRCRSMSIHRQKPGVVHFDGDPMETGSDVEIAVVPKGLQCICSQKEGVYDPVENVQNTLVEQFNMMYVRSEELIKVNKRNNERIVEQTRGLLKKLKPRKK